MGINQNDIADLVNSTWQKLVKSGAFTDLQTDLTDHVAVREMWKGKKNKFEGGLDWRFDCQMDHNHSAKTVELYETDSSTFVDNMKEGVVNPRHINAHYIFDVREKAFQRGGRAIVDYVETKYTGMIVSFYEKLEELLWSKPASSANEKDPYGIPYWITKNATEGFNGGNPAGFSNGKAGIDANTYTRWKNWTAQYTNVSKEDLVRKMRRAHRKSRFRSPVSHANPNISMGNGIYTNDAVIGLIEEILEDQNMNLGRDVASMDGKAMFKGTPLQYAPYLDNDSTDPVYMIDWQKMGIGCTEGWEYNLTAPYMVPNKHNVRRVDLDVSLNMIATDLRKQAVISKAS
jgi:hypothetical protein